MSAILAVNLVLLILFIGLVGWCAWHLVFSMGAGSRQEGGEGPAPFMSSGPALLLSGLGTVSFILYLLGRLGKLSLGSIGLATGVLLALYFVKFLCKGPCLIGPSLIRFFLYLLLVAGLCLGFMAVAPPYQAVVHGNDASTFTGAAYFMAEEGGLLYPDHLAGEMTASERALFFPQYGTIEADNRIIRLRHRGGMLMYESEPPEVSVGFFHLFPLWLSLGNLSMGDQGVLSGGGQGFLAILAFFAVMNLMILYYLGKGLGGRLAGLALVLISFFFFPQLYHLCIPLSETLLQLLLLGGLLLFLQRGKRGTVLPAGQQCLIGLLWGAAIFTKVETLVLLPLCLATAFTFIPRLRKELPRYAPMILCTAFAYLLALHIQFFMGSYVQQIHNWCKDIPLISDPMTWMTASHWNRGILFFALWLSLAGVLLWEKKRAPGKAWITARSLVMAAAVILCIALHIKLRFHPNKITGVYEWFTYYMNLLIMLLLAAGIPMTLLGAKDRRVSLRVMLIFFAMPGIIYWIDPMVHSFHPFAIRRFVPLFFPLFLILGLVGWQAFLNRFVTRPFMLSRVLFSVMAICCTISFAQTTIPVLNQPLYENAIKQMEKSMALIPESGLVIVPENIAGHALHLGLQYLCHRDTLLLPVCGSEGEPADDQATRAYLDRLLASREVVVILHECATSPPMLCNYFGLEPVETFSLSFPMIHQMDVFDGMPRPFIENYHVFRLTKGDKRPGSSVIFMGQPLDDLPYIRRGFHLPESNQGQTFRWTDGNALMVVPAARKIRMMLCPHQTCTRIDLEITINGVKVKEIPYLPYNPTSPQTIEVDVPESARGTGRFMELGLSSAARKGKKNPVGGESRTLSLLLFRVEWMD